MGCVRSPRAATVPKRPAAVPKLSFRCLRHSPRGLRQSPRSFRSPLSSPGATIPEEPVRDDTSTCPEESSLSSHSYESSNSGARSSRSRQLFESGIRRTTQAVPKLDFAGVQSSMQGTTLIGAVPPEEPGAQPWQAASPRLAAPARSPRNAVVHPSSPRSLVKRTVGKAASASSASSSSLPAAASSVSTPATTAVSRSSSASTMSTLPVACDFNEHDIGKSCAEATSARARAGSQIAEYEVHDPELECLPRERRGLSTIAGLVDRLMTNTRWFPFLHGCVTRHGVRGDELDIGLPRPVRPKKK